MSSDDNRDELAARLAYAERELELLKRAKRRVGLSFQRIPETGSQVEVLIEGSFPYFQHSPSSSYSLKDRHVHELASGSQLSEATDGNITLIEGENLAVLTALQLTHRGRVDVIYIDPPYNTGSNDFIYNDSRLSSIKDIKGVSSEDYVKTLDGKARPVGIGDPERHSLWLSFMERRLFLAKELLSNTGVIFVSIDDNEQARLKILMDEVFGEQNFISTVIHQRAKGGGQAKHVVKGHDYIHIFAKNEKTMASLGRPKVVQGKTEWIDGIEYLINDDVVRKTFGKKDPTEEDRRCAYEELLHYKDAAAKEKIDVKIASGEYFLKKVSEERHLICSRTPINDLRSKIYSIIKALSEEGKKDLEALGLSSFSYPKSLELMKQIVGSINKTDAIILDFFAGSGTTGHAVAALNKEDGGERKCILVTHGDENGKNIAEDITAERIKRALSGQNWAAGKTNESLPGELNYYKLAFASQKYDNETNTELFQSKFEGYAALQHDVVAIPVQPKPEFYTVMASRQKIVVVVKDLNYLWDKFEEFEAFLTRLKEESEKSSHHIELVVCVPSSDEFDGFRLGDKGWKYSPFPVKYLKSHAKLIEKMKANGTLIPINGTEDITETKSTVGSDNHTANFDNESEENN